MFSMAQSEALCHITKMVAKRMKGERRPATGLGQMDGDPALTRPDSWAVVQRGW